MKPTIKRHQPPPFATEAAHQRYYGYVVVPPLATTEADVLGHYRTRRAAEQAARSTFWDQSVQVMTRYALRQLAPLPEAPPPDEPPASPA